MQINIHLSGTDKLTPSSVNDEMLKIHRSDLSVLCAASDTNVFCIADDSLLRYMQFI